jgi:sugar lactone lactonase YvrE
MKKTILRVASISSFIAFAQTISAQTIGTFNSVMATAQTQNFEIPSTHTFQRVIRSGTALTAGGTLGDALDFTGYVPIAGSSTNGYLSISSEAPIGECAILNISFNGASKLWDISSSGKVTFPMNEVGLVATFCSGTVTPNNTIIVGEEVVLNLDANSDSYQDVGWLIEIDPATRTVKNQDGVGGADKLWAMGRQKHENVAIKSEQTVAYWGADDGTNGYLYKFVPTTAGNFSAGLLYVLETTGVGAGTWKAISNTTKAERNNTIAASTAAGAFNFNRIEDVEIGPDGKVYFAATATGIVHRLTDNGTTVSNLEAFVDHTTFDVDGDGPGTPVQFDWPDNLAFDNEGNLWILQDGGGYHIWVVAPGHTTADQAIKIFANTPFGSEPTGITFSLDSKFLFLSLQHPSSSNNVAQKDAAGEDVIFNTHTTLVIARNEDLGSGSVLPLHFVDLGLQRKDDGVEVNWKVQDANKHDWFEVERSTDGSNFKQIVRNQAPANSTAVATFTYTDKFLPATAIAYYRIRSCDVNGSCIYSQTKSIRLPNAKHTFKLSPLPVRQNLNVAFNVTGTKSVVIKVLSNEGKEMYTTTKKVFNGHNDIVIPVQNFAKGMYVVTMTVDGQSESQSFIKQ